MDSQTKRTIRMEINDALDCYEAEAHFDGMSYDASDGEHDKYGYVAKRRLEVDMLIDLVLNTVVEQTGMSIEQLFGVEQ